MAFSKAFQCLLFFLFFFCLPHFFFASAIEFAVGGDEGWVVPTVKDDQLYNQWAGKNRFKVNDTLRFEYKKDSVLVVTKEEYEKCKSSYPIFFSNNGKTIYQLEQPGLYYFISGVSGHCERGLKMIIKVLEPEVSPPPQSANDTSSPTVTAGGNVGNVINVMMLVVLLIIGLFM